MRNPVTVTPSQDSGLSMAEFVEVMSTYLPQIKEIARQGHERMPWEGLRRMSTHGASRRLPAKV